MLFDRIGALIRHDLLIALVVLSTVLALAFPEIVFGGKTLLAGNVTGVMGLSPPFGYDDQEPLDDFRLDRGASAWQIEPWARETRETYADLNLPLWNANVGAGVPLLANMQSAAFNPLRLPVLISPDPYMWDLYLLGRLLVGGLFAFLFARLVGMAVPAGLITAIGYILSGHFMLYSNNHWLDVYLVLPLVLYGVETTVRHGKAGGTALLALAVAFNLLAGMPEPSFLAILLAGGYAAYRLASSTLEQTPPRVAAQRALLLGLGFLAGFALAAPALIPFREYVSNAFTLHLPERQFGLVSDPPRFSISLLVPYFNGSPADNDRVMGWWSGVRNYVGVALPLLAVLGLWHRQLARKAGWFFLAAALLALTKTYGVPAINDLGRLPLANLMGFPQWIAPLIAFCVAFLAGAGADRVFREERLGWSLHLAGSLVVAALISLLLYNRDALDTLTSESRLWVGLAFGLLIVIWALLWIGRRLGSKQLAWACLALVAGEMLLFAPHGIYRDRHDTFAKPPYVDFLQMRQAEEGRTRLFGFDALLFPNDANAYDLDDIRDLDALYPERYIKYVQTFISPEVHDRFVGGPYASVEGIPQPAGNPMFDLMGAKYILTGPNGLNAILPSPLIDEIVARVGATPEVRRSGFVINEVEKPVLFAHPPSDIVYEVTPTPERHVLRFSVALDPASWAAPGDGVMFEVALAGSVPTTVFSHWLDPKTNAADRRWLDGAVDLGPYLGQPVTLHLRTLPGRDSNSDWSGWGDLRLTGAEDGGSGPSQFELAYNAEVRIYRNLNAFPRAFVVHRVEEAADEEAALTRMQQHDFNPADLAIIEGTIPPDARDRLSDAPESDRSQARVRQYEDNRVELDVLMENPGLVLLTDTYYPGWKVYVDGERAMLYPTDYLFRGVLVDEGEHEVEFVYDPASFKLGAAISVIALLSLLGLWGLERWLTLGQTRMVKGRLRSRLGL